MNYFVTVLSFKNGFVENDTAECSVIGMMNDLSAIKE